MANPGALFAILTLIALRLILLYVLVQRAFVRGLLAGAVKGWPNGGRGCSHADIRVKRLMVNNHRLKRRSALRLRLKAGLVQSHSDDRRGDAEVVVGLWRLLVLLYSAQTSSVTLPLLATQ